MIRLDKKCRRCRREDQKLFLKGEKCLGPKCPFTRRSYAPGEHGQARGVRPSEYLRQLREKQKAARIYGVSERVLGNVFKKARRTRSSIIELLELRLDNAIYRSGLAPSRAAARSYVSHGHILIDGRKITIPSFEIGENNQISLGPKASKGKIGENLAKYLKKYNPPAWISLDKKKMSATITRLPKKEEIEGIIAEPLIIEYYSK